MVVVVPAAAAATTTTLPRPLSSVYCSIPNSVRVIDTAYVPLIWLCDAGYGAKYTSPSVSRRLLRITRPDVAQS